jgi:hypothetical protein
VMATVSPSMLTLMSSFLTPGRSPRSTYALSLSEISTRNGAAVLLLSKAHRAHEKAARTDRPACLRTGVKRVMPVMRYLLLVDRAFPGPVLRTWAPAPGFSRASATKYLSGKRAVRQALPGTSRRPPLTRGYSGARPGKSSTRSRGSCRLPPRECSYNRRFRHALRLILARSLLASSHLHAQAPSGHSRGPGDRREVVAALRLRRADRRWRPAIRNSAWSRPRSRSS